MVRAPGIRDAVTRASAFALLASLLLLAFVYGAFFTLLCVRVCVCVHVCLYCLFTSLRIFASLHLGLSSSLAHVCSLFVCVCVPLPLFFLRFSPVVCGSLLCLSVGGLLSVRDHTVTPLPLPHVPLV